MAARRVVSVALEAKTGQARKDIRETAADVRKLSTEAKATGKNLDDMAAEATMAGRKLDTMAEKAAKADRGLDEMAAGTKRAKVETGAYKRELGQLDRQIDATILHLKALGREYANGSVDKGILKAIAAERAMLRRLQQIRKDLTPTLPPVGPLGTAGGFMSGLPASPVLIGSLVAIATAALPAIGAAVGGAVLGAVGTGGVIGGIAAASRDPRVREAASGFGRTFMDGLHDAGDPFVEPLVQSLHELEMTSASFTSTLGRGFAKLAPVIGPLTKGVDGLFRGIDRGLDSIFSGPSQKALRALANELPEIGDAIGDMLTSIADGSDGATMGLIELLHITEDAIRFTGEFIRVLSDLFEMEVKAGYGATLWADQWLGGIQKVTQYLGPLGIAVDQYRTLVQDLNAEDASLIEGLNKASDAGGDWDLMLRRLAGSADAARRAQVDFAKSINDQFDPTANLIHRLQDVRTAQNDYTEAVKEHGRRSPEARDAELKVAEAILAANSAAATAAGTFRGQFSESLRATLRAGHMTEDQIRDVEKAFRDARRAGERYADVYKAKAILEFYSYRHDEVAASRRWGGITEHAATGTLREANVYSPAGPARYAFAEPATGGEAFIPRLGDPARSMGILNRAAQWYGASVVTGGFHQAPAASAPPISIQVNVSPGAGTGELAKALVSTLRTEIKFLGGNVQTSLGSP